MNETIRTILSRRSIRKFKAEQISEEELQTILEAGKYAPSAMNQQSWHFTVVQNKEILSKINEAARTAIINTGNPDSIERAKAEGFNIYYNAPTFIIVSGDDKAIAPKNDCSLALGNMFLAAESLEIGSCWINIMNFLLSLEENKALKSELGIPEGYTVAGSGAFGYKAVEQPASAPRRDGTVNFIR